MYWGKSTFSTWFISFKNVCKIQDLTYKLQNFLGGRGNDPPNPTSSPHHFHLGYCFLIWASSLKISVAQLAINYAQKLNLASGTLASHRSACINTSYFLSSIFEMKFGIIKP